MGRTDVGILIRHLSHDPDGQMAIESKLSSHGGGNDQEKMVTRRDFSI